MSQSFEDRFGDRLGGFESKPPVGADRAIFAKLGSSQPGWLQYRSQVAVSLAFLLGAGILFFLSFSEPEFIAEVASPAESEEQVRDVWSSTGRRSGSILDQGAKEDVSESNEATREVATDAVIAAAHIPGLKLPVSSNEQIIAVETREKESFDRLSWLYARQVGMPWNARVGLPGNLEAISTEEVIVNRTQKIRFLPYIDMGMFLQYNQVEPNLDDGLVIHDFSGDPAIALSRVGAYVETGFYKALTPKTTFRVGATLNIQPRRYRFTVRNAAADEFDASGENILEPVFEESNVEIDHYSIAIGTRMTGFFSIFPTKANQLVASLDYQYNLTSDYQFEFQDQHPRIQYPNQLLLGIGLQKILVQGRRGNLMLNPMLKYSLLPIRNSKDAALSIRPFNAGVSLSYWFK